MHPHGPPRHGDFYDSDHNIPQARHATPKSDPIAASKKKHPDPYTASFFLLDARNNPCEGPRHDAQGLTYQGVEGKGPEALRWVRPLQSIHLHLRPGNRGADRHPVSRIDGLTAGNTTSGHRFHDRTASPCAPFSMIMSTSSSRAPKKGFWVFFFGGGPGAEKGRGPRGQKREKDNPDGCAESRLRLRAANWSEDEALLRRGSGLSNGRWC